MHDMCLRRIRQVPVKWLARLCALEQDRALLRDKAIFSHGPGGLVREQILNDLGMNFAT